MATLIDPPRQAPPVYSVAEFVDRVLDIQPDEHASWIGSTGRGKTTIMMRAMGAAAARYPKVRYVLIVGKPHRGPEYKGPKEPGDKTVARLARQLGARIVRDWPPPPVMPWRTRPTFDVLWPLKLPDPRQTDARNAAIIERFLLDAWHRGGTTIGADEGVYIDKDLGLGDLLDIDWRMGRSIEVPVWFATQMPTHCNRKAFSMASHLFLWRDNDKDARRRYAEIGAIDPDLVSWALSKVHGFACLYIRTDGPDGPEWAVLR